MYLCVYIYIYIIYYHLISHNISPTLTAHCGQTRVRARARAQGTKPNAPAHTHDANPLTLPHAPTCAALLRQATPLRAASDSVPDPVDLEGDIRMVFANSPVKFRISFANSTGISGYYLASPCRRSPPTRSPTSPLGRSATRTRTAGGKLSAHVHRP